MKVTIKTIKPPSANAPQRRTPLKTAMEESFANLISKTKILAAIIYNTTLWTVSVLFALLFLSICAGRMIKELLSKPHDSDGGIHESIRVNSCEEINASGLEGVTGHTKLNNADGEEGALRVFRDVYRDRGVKNVGMLDMSESEPGERDELLSQVGREEGCFGHGYRRPTCETDDEGER